MTDPLTTLSETRVFGGRLKRVRHQSAAVACEMTFAVFLPPQVDSGAKVPVFYWLSGLTCTDENFTQKAGAFRVAAELGLAADAAFQIFAAARCTGWIAHALEQNETGRLIRPRARYVGPEPA